MEQNNSEILIYQSEDGQTKIDVKVDDETVWLSLNQIAELFQRDKSVIAKHIKNVLKKGLSRRILIKNFYGFGLKREDIRERVLLLK